MVRTDVPSSQHAPSAVIPQAGKSFDDVAKSTGTQVRTVLREDKARFNFVNDSQHFEPKAATVSGKSCTFTCGGYVLTGESAADAVNESSPGLSVESVDVVPDWESGQVSVFLPLLQDASGVFLDLDCTDRPVSEQQVSEDSAASSCK